MVVEQCRNQALLMAVGTFECLGERLRTTPPYLRIVIRDSPLVAVWNIWLWVAIVCCDNSEDEFARSVLKSRMLQTGAACSYAVQQRGFDTWLSRLDCIFHVIDTGLGVGVEMGVRTHHVL